MAVENKNRPTFAHLKNRAEQLGTTHSVQIGPRQVMTYVSGAESATDSVPIVLLAGAFVSSRYWQRLLPFLPTGRRIVSVDIIGVGQTSRARAPRDMALLAQAAMLAELFDALRIKQADILGASYGGNIGLTFAGLYPDKVHSVAAIEAPITATSYEWLHQVRSGLDWLRGGWLPFWLIVKSGLLARRWTNALLGRRLSTAPGDKKSSVFRCFYDPYARLGSWRALLRAPIDDPMRPLTGIRAPILFLQASESPLRGQLDRTHELLSRLKPSLTWQTLPLAQHDVAVQLPVVVAEAVDSFWTSRI